MQIIALTPAMLNSIVEGAIRLGETKRDIELLNTPSTISQNMAWKKFKKSKVKAWVKNGVINEYKDVNPLNKKETIRYSVLELQRASLSSNLLTNMSQKDKDETQELYGKY